MTGNWEGVTASEHATVGGRAWCHDDREWCYPDDHCRCCLEASEEWITCGACHGRGYIKNVPNPLGLTHDDGWQE